tara:strand:+ start:17717 stop:19669 length:1953 start_codon:yes stop_codon:yes gene_type:complete
MTGIYKTGTITLNSNSNIVTGNGTLFQSVANARLGDLFSLDGKEFFEIYQVDTETQLRIRNLVTGAKYQGQSVAAVSYAIVRNFAASTDAQIASDVVSLQQRWHQREREMTEWFASDANYHQITDIRGDKVLVITPTGLNNLVDGPVNIEDFGFPSAKESQALDLNDFPAGIFYTRPLSIAHQPPGFGSGIKLVITNKSEAIFYQKIIELSTSKVRYRIATTAANAELWNTLGSEDGGSAQVTWNDIQGEIPVTATRWPSFQEVTGDVAQILPDTAKRWPSFSEVSGDINSLLADFAKRWPSFEEVTGDILPLLPETATRWPDFQEVTGTVSDEQLPESVTQDKKSLAISPRIKREQSLTQRLTDYPTLKKTEVRPTESPNNKRMIQFDDVRTEVHIALTDRWFTIPTTIASRAFPVFYRGLILRFNNSSSYSGNIKMRVYPMGTGGLGLPNNPTLADHQWHEYETTVTDLYKIGEFGSQYFEGIIEYIELDTGWHQFDVNQSNVGSLNAKFDVAFGTFRSPFRTFYQKADGYWYSEDMTPENPNSIGPSWTRDVNDPRTFTVTDASDSTDALRFFGDSYDDFQFEIILDVEYITHVMAVTVSNSDPNRIYYPGPARFLTNDRIYFKRGGSTTNAKLTIESIKMRIPHYG